MRQKRVRQKEDRENPCYGSGISLGRVGLRGVQSEQIQTDSSFFLSVAEFFNI